MGVFKRFSFNQIPNPRVPVDFRLGIFFMADTKTKVVKHNKIYTGEFISSSHLPKYIRKGLKEWRR